MLWSFIFVFVHKIFLDFLFHVKFRILFILVILPEDSFLTLFVTWNYFFRCLGLFSFAYWILIYSVISIRLAGKFIGVITFRQHTTFYIIFVLFFFILKINLLINLCY